MSSIHLAGGSKGLEQVPGGLEAQHLVGALHGAGCKIVADDLM